ncbi:ribosome small subunit-dependent GTPase A [Arthrobacter sp. 260]|uniref:ribosome small subunit-dependent GTPase A n=1 Tax=Arthrobacter sp. 260 TaxID=2735314 RepID=UPI0014916364|nr:ribosome small subunit-dependent GTPase A [Arthrobacter sp. 260]NOJ58408.1 ribosome small subunit-dependent GTPase A [Arthrobacter sp. 260]
MDELQHYGLTDRISSLFGAAFPDRQCKPGRVVRVDRSRMLVATAHGIEKHDARPDVATGDWVALTGADSTHSAIVGVMPRYSVLQRKKAHDPLAEVQVLAANVDLVGVVVPLDRPISSNRLERTLVAAWDSGAVPLVILTKADLSNRFDEVVAQTVERAGAAEVLTTSADTGDGLDEVLARFRPGATVVLLGPSGAGKSSLVNALVGTAVQDTGAVRAGDGRGKHTTTSRELIPLPGGAVLMDTPGVRGFALWDAAGGLDEVFGDIEELFAHCRFTDCRHGPEPGCAVQAALASGALEERRWLSYQKMAEELEHLHRRQTDVSRIRDRGSHHQARESAMAKDHRNRFRKT